MPENNVPQLEKKEYWTMQYRDFDKFVQEWLGIDYECVAANELNNYSCVQCDDVKREDFYKEFFQKYDLPEILEAKKLGKSSRLSISQLLEYFVGKGILPEGNYLIEVYW